MATATTFPISKTKIIVPKRRPEIIARPRLIETLYELLDKKLTLISAPAGSGKTSLLIDFVDKNEIPVCWLSLDPLDQEPQRFLSYMVACICERFPAFGKESSATLQSISSVEKDNERLVIAFTNEILQEISEHFAIVLDDYHFIDSIPEIRAFIDRFIQLASENCHLILASRTLPLLPNLHLLAARDQVGGISFENLAFLPEEIQAFFKQNSGERLSLDDANQLADQTDGWVTSLTLSSLSQIDRKTQQQASIGKTGVELFDYFAREILAKQTSDVSEFLLLTSVFDEIEPTLCGKVLDPLFQDHPRDWKSLLEGIQKNNLFVIPVGIDGKSFRYHHLFRDYLREKLQEDNPALLDAVLTNLARVYRAQQEWEKAHFIYETMEDEDALVELIEQAGMHFIRNGRIVTLGKWLERLSVSSLQQNPMLLSLQGAVAHTQGQTQLGISLLSQAEIAFREKQDISNLCITLVRRAAVYREVGNYDLSLADADEVIELTRDKANDSLLDSFAVAQRAKGLILYYQGKASEAVMWLENALSLFSSLKESSYIPVIEMELGMVYHARGNYETALKFYHSALKIWEATGNLGWQATLLNNLGVLYHFIGDYGQAFALLEKALECAQRSGYVRVPALALCSLGDLLADLQDFDRCDECYDQTLIMASQLADKHLVYYVSLMKARIARLRANFSLGERLLLDLSLLVDNHAVSPDEEALFHLEYGCMLLYLGRSHESVDEFVRVVALHKESGRLIDLCIGRLWLACALIASRKKEEAISQLRDLFFVAKKIESPGPLYINATQLYPWLENFRAPDDIAGALLQLLTKAGQFEKSIPSLRRKLRQTSHTISISPPHLIICAFGAAQVIYNKKIITLSDWQTRETRDLFFFFLYSKPATKEEIASVFWPDISPARLKMRFKTSIYRLRHAVGQETILFEDGCYEFNHGIDYVYDIEKFQQLLAQADESKDAEEIIRRLNTAVDLAKRSYLADIDAEWAVSERMRINTLYQAAMLRLAKLHLEAGRAKDALEACQIALAADPLLEEAYRLSMRAYAVLGDRAAVARQFRICSDIFEDELGVKPSEETELLYQQLN